MVTLPALSCVQWRASPTLGCNLAFYMTTLSREETVGTLPTFLLAFPPTTGFWLTWRVLDEHINRIHQVWTPHTVKNILQFTAQLRCIFLQWNSNTFHMLLFCHKTHTHFLLLLIIVLLNHIKTRQKKKKRKENSWQERRAPTTNTKGSQGWSGDLAARVFQLPCPSWHTHKYSSDSVRRMCVYVWIVRDEVPSKKVSEGGDCRYKEQFSWLHLSRLGSKNWMLINQKNPLHKKKHEIKIKL